MAKSCILLCLIGFAQFAFTQNELALMGELAAATQVLEAKNILDYGNNCVVANERRREDSGKALLNSLTDRNQAGLGRIVQEFKSLSTVSGNFCNSLKNLQCQSNGKCGCANAEINGIRMSSVRENNACRLDRGSACIPAESMASLGSRAPDLKCKATTTCQLTSDRSVCTQARMMQAIMGSYRGDRGNMQAFTQHIMNKMKEGVCACN